ncbi:HAMP domain-containing sensor histidine kinase [Staphylococcus epidermidis]|jgi:signal transduction histidine-protein kinase arlS|uniref:HAMP domain-containing sensor histidine kinase n=1 Tax=Staphylococcus epidermidis TaxID=1282 RepID=UPI00026C0E86|nr:HAMP domain-containing histidine kinase [Staphylococcus epidermidis]EJE01969.1 signal transduction histidine-protein kinase ArlS [Staphylococcus epidermidis NIHLM040]KAB2193567.1 HAMP domain-containing histidine kinase [Staphylococcus epidermidis]KAB2282488.1 HAMP domain-containing histidine kinase [Staphylococcus epidermidis]KTF27962.1 histidine kinase [Staphylococcus epidermidis FS1]MBC2965235.1 HAMP domain-containing sensor histidine kinase [Staphylococcus epidermidis]
MIKRQKLKYKWMLITTLITFTTILLFCLIIIFFLKDTLRSSEIDEAERSSNDIANLFHSKSLSDISALDLNASLENFQEILIYDDKGRKLIQTSNDNTLAYDNKIDFKHPERIHIQRSHGINYLVITEPIRSKDFSGYSVLVHSLQNYDNLVKSLYIVALAFGLIATIITAGVSYIFSSQITKPIVTMSNKMNQIRRDGFQNKLELTTNYEETDNLIDTFNEMMYQIEESFNQQRQFVEDASHELRTPLQIIQGHLNLIQRWGKKDPAVLEESLNISIEEVNRITKLVEELLLLTKDRVNHNVLECENVDVNSEIQSRVKSLQHLHPDYTFETHLATKPIQLKINRHQFEQLLLIFIDNAMKYDTEHKYIKIVTQLKNKMIMIDITDHGMGIPKADLEFIFDRFYRVDKSRARSQGGNGLGLSIAEKIVQLNGGMIQVESELQKYTTFKISFPVLN